MISKKIIKIEGTIEQSSVGLDAWLFHSNHGKTYELLRVPEQLKINQSKVALWLQPDPTFITMNMLGIPAYVKGFEFRKIQ